MTIFNMKMFLIFVIFLLLKTSWSQYNQVEDLLFFQQNNWAYISNTLTQGSSVD